MTQSYLESGKKVMFMCTYNSCIGGGLICITGKKKDYIISQLSSQQLEVLKKTKVLKIIIVEINELLDCWLVMTLFFSHHAGASLFRWNLANVSKSLDACSKIRCDILLTLQRSSQWK